MDVRELRLRLLFKSISFFVLILSTTVETAETQDSTRVRTWTEWINTDVPSDVNPNDDETAISIRRRGVTVCDGETRIDAVCRIVGLPRTVFNHLTAGAQPDFLIMPCTVEGLLCQADNQPSERDFKKCQNYEIRFECIKETIPEEANLGVIAVAAGLSVFVPIICVVFMHVFRVVRERRLVRTRGLNRSLSSSLNTENTDRASQTDLPPSYFQLFGTNTYSSTETLLEQRAGAPIDAEIGVLNNPGFVGSNTSLDITSDLNTSDQSEQDVFSVSSGQLSIAPSNTTLPVRVNVETSVRGEQEQPASPVRGDGRRPRLPGMHLSAFDLFTSRRTSREVSAEELQTPPPTYLEAMVILAKLPPKSP